MINERIKQLIETVSGGNKRAFSLLIGVSPTVIENIVGSRKGKPGYELLEKIIFSIENINTEWLFTGRGDILKTEKRYSIQESPAMIAAEPRAEYSSDSNSLIYKMYKEKDEENKILLKEIGRLEERLEKYESSVPTAKAVSSEKTPSKTRTATSASARFSK